jgi:hypothetical protein
MAFDGACAQDRRGDQWKFHRFAVASHAQW